MDAKRAELEPIDGAKAAAFELFVEARRAEDWKAVLEAVRVLADMPVPGSSRCEHIEALREVFSHAIFWSRNPAVREIRKREQAKKFSGALNALAFHWEHCEKLHGLKVTSASIVAVRSEGGDASVFPEGEAGNWAFVDTNTDAIYRVEPIPQAGKRYLLVDADAMSALDAEHGRHGLSQELATGALDLLSEAIEWTMPDPTAPKPPKRKPTLEELERRLEWWRRHGLGAG